MSEKRSVLKALACVPYIPAKLTWEIGRVIFFYFFVAMTILPEECFYDDLWPWEAMNRIDQ